MARRIQFRRGTSAQHSVFVGAPGEITVDTDKNIIVVHDGATPGGFPANRLQDVVGNITFDGRLSITSGTPSTSVATGSLVVDGGVGIAGRLTVDNIVETSSIAFKENVNPIDNALESILKLSGVVYDRKDGSEFNESGLIAEDVDKIIPSLVTKDEKGNPYGIKYTKLVAYLVEAIKDQQKQIEDLKKRTGNGLSGKQI
jgi:hypothetical protein